MPDLVGRAAGKLVLVNDDDLTYCTMRLDPASLTTLIDRVADITEPLPRTLCWSAAWEMTREAELKARDFVTLVQRGIHTESEVGVVQRLLLQAQTALNSYAEQEWAASTGWPAFTTRLLELARGAEPGSDHQLAFVNSLTGSVLDPLPLAVLAGWLDGSAPLEGLTVDTDLRWRLLHALVAHGKADGRRSTPSWPATTPPPAAARRSAPARCARRRRPRPTRGSARCTTTSCRTRSATRSSRASRTRARRRCSARTWQYFEVIDEVWQRRSSERAQPWRSGCSRRGRWPGHGDGVRRVAGGRAPAGPAAAGVGGPGRHRARPRGAGLRRPGLTQFPRRRLVLRHGPPPVR